MGSESVGLFALWFIDCLNGLTGDHKIQRSWPHKLYLVGNFVVSQVLHLSRLAILELKCQLPSHYRDPSRGINSKWCWELSDTGTAGRESDALTQQLPTETVSLCAFRFPNDKLSAAAVYKTIFFATLPPLLLGVLFFILLPDVRDAQVWVQPVQSVRVEVGETEAQRGHTAQLVDFCYLLDDTLSKIGETWQWRRRRQRGGG